MTARTKRLIHRNKVNAILQTLQTQEPPEEPEAPPEESQADETIAALQAEIARLKGVLKYHLGKDTF